MIFLQAFVFEALDNAIENGFSDILTLDDELLCADMMDCTDTFEYESIESLLPHVQAWKIHKFAQLNA